MRLRSVCQLGTVYPQRFCLRFRRTVMPLLRQFNLVPPLVDSKLRTGAKVWEEEAVLLVINVEDACTATRRSPV